MISILMSVYNCESTVEKAIRSIQNQTYVDWELIICDDGSTDKTLEKIRSIKHKDKRIKLLKNSVNRGLSYSLNRCFRKSSGDYIARMDGDDISLPERLQKELNILEQGFCDIVSSWMLLSKKDGSIWGELKNPQYPQKADLIKGNPIAHAPVMMKRYCLERVKGYRVLQKTERVEDVDLWIRLYEQGYKAYNIQESLYNMLDDRAAFSRRKYKYRVNSTLVRLEGCKRLGLGLKSYLYAFKPMVLGLIPQKLRYLMRKKISG